MHSGQAGKTIFANMPVLSNPLTKWPFTISAAEKHYTNECQN